MKKPFAVVLGLLIALSTKAQNYPSEWRAYMSDGYFHAVESGVNDQKLPEERFRNDLLELARTNLAKQIEVKVNEVSQMSKDVVNGHANIHYESQRTSYTDVDMKFAESKNYVDIVSGKQYVIVYINKENACRYYENEAKQLIDEIDNKLIIAENYSNTGFKSKAKNELEKTLTSFDDAGEIFFWLNVYGMTDCQLEQYRDRLNQQEQTVKKKIADMENARRYYENEAKRLINEIDKKLMIAENYSNTGFKSKAKNELDNALALFGNADEILSWLSVYGVTDYQIEQYRDRLNQQEQTVKKKIADMEYGTTYCVVCNADNFGRKYAKLTNEIKGDLSESGCNFVDDSAAADFVIYIDASSREYNISVVGNVTAYYSYVDAKIAIDKVATNQRIFEDEISVKGAHTLSYDEAGRDGYKKIRKEIAKMLKENIKP